MTEIREARPGDRPALVGFMAALQDHEHRREPNRLPGAEMADAHLAALEAWVADGGAVLVAESGGRPVGFLVYGIEEELGCYVLPENRRVGLLSDLYVAPEARGQGISRALVREAETRLRAAGIRRVEIGVLAANAPARAVYEALGYAVSDLTMTRSL